MDNAPQHTAKTVMDFPEDNPNVEIIWLPPGTPELSAMEEYWHQAKYDILVGKYYKSKEDMRHAMSEYFRTRRHGLDVIAYIGRMSLNPKNF